jgi:hypothetical protein
MPQQSIRWTNPSVVRLAGGADPVATIERLAKVKVLEAFDRGWSGPPFDPSKIAALMGIPIEANAGVDDARTVPTEGGVKIEFNPMQTRERVRFSLAHEVAHALFPDVGDAVRHRGADAVRADDWQLEMLCNLAAAEFVMPLGSLPARDNIPSIESLMVERRAFDVSAEAFLLRIVKVSMQPLFLRFLSRMSSDAFRLEYGVASSAWRELFGATAIGDISVVASSCTAIGQTVASEKEWPGIGSVKVECVGIPGHPGSEWPRVAVLVRQHTELIVADTIRFVHGDVLRPSGAGPKIVCQLVNDRAGTWGGGVARASAKKYPDAQARFKDWLGASPKSARLGKVHFAKVEDDVFLASVVGQEGFGTAAVPRIRYGALERGLEEVAAHARELGASIHMPRLGSGMAGGNWQTVENLIRDVMSNQGLSVTVYDLPPRRGEHTLQLT